jgi:hypothetical protein
MLNRLKSSKVIGILITWTFFFIHFIRTGCFSFGNAYNAKLCGNDAFIGFAIFTLILGYLLISELRREKS